MAKIVHVIGTGTIGEPLTGILCQHAKELGLDEVTFHKRTPLKTDRSKVVNLVDRRGAKLAVDSDRMDDFKSMGMKPTYTAEQALERASVVIDCTPVGNQMKEQVYGDYLDNTLGFIAQGSEFGFGKMYARGVNDSALVRGEDRFLHVVSCNTHNLAVILQTIGFPSGNHENVKSGRFLCIRRANDVTQDGSFVPSPTANKHSDQRFGTHHARDVWHLYQTLGVDVPGLFSSALKVNSQYMHMIQFALELNEPTSLDAIRTRIRENDVLSETWKTSTNSVFSFGRDQGHFGRILNQTVFCLPSLHVSDDGKSVTGFCFTPQDGNPILSSVSAAMWFLYEDEKEHYDRLQALRPYFFDEV